MESLVTRPDTIQVHARRCFRERAGTGTFIAIPLDFRKTPPYRDLRLILYTDPFFGILTLNAPEANLKLANVCSRLTRVAKPVVALAHLVCLPGIV